jgi:hypothetical protein
MKLVFFGRFESHAYVGGFSSKASSKKVLLRRVDILPSPDDSHTAPLMLVIPPHRGAWGVLNQRCAQSLRLSERGIS